jgi:uncharacterized protein
MQPLAPRERLVTIDVLRGLALLGVLIANLHVLYSGRWMAHEAPPVGVDAAAQWFIELAVESRAQSLLTLLFGFGFAIQLARANERGDRVVPVYARRMLALFVLGWLHILLLWWGDVTSGYAVAGCALLVFRGAPVRARWIAAAVLILVPPVIEQILGTGDFMTRALFGPHAFERLSTATISAMHGHDRVALTIAQARLNVFWGLQDFAYPLWLVGHFLIGYAIGVRRWFDRDGADHLAVFHKLLWWGLPVTAAHLAWTVFLATGGLAAYDVPVVARMAHVVFHELGVLAQVGVYVAAVVLVMQRPAGRRVLGVFAPLGRMPLTTYVMQSLICTFLFYAWGLEWPIPSVTGDLEIAAVLYAAQVMIAQLWLRAFRFGPLEWIWRAAVYLKLPRLRVS